MLHAVPHSLVGTLRRMQRPHALMHIGLCAQSQRQFPTRCRARQIYVSLMVRDLQALASGSDVWLIDHALSFAEVGDAVAAMRSQPQLLHRIAGILEIPSQTAAEEQHNGEAEVGSPPDKAEAETVSAPAKGELAGGCVVKIGTPLEPEEADEALMQQVVGRIHEIAYDVVFQESATAQRGTRKHRHAR